MADISNAESSYMRGRSAFKEWKIRFDSRWFRPLAVTQLTALWGTIGDQEKAALRSLIPEDMDRVEKLVSKLNHRPGGM